MNIGPLLLEAGLNEMQHNGVSFLMQCISAFGGSLVTPTRFYIVRRHHVFLWSARGLLRSVEAESPKAFCGDDI
jgi:hypothetical protein